jgi:hypothetical protein
MTTNASGEASAEVAAEGAIVAADARRSLEARTGKSAVSPRNVKSLTQSELADSAEQ